MRIGILGGSFNPPHIGHLTIAHEAKLQYKLDKVIFMPAGHPYMKDPKDMASYDDRLKMVRDATSSTPFYYSTMEKDDTCSYTCNTLERMKEYHKDDELFFIIGADSLIDMVNWKNPEKIFKLATILVAERGQMSLTNTILEYKAKYGANIKVISDVNIVMSSSYIRDKIRKHGSYQYLVPESVAEYIKGHNLYAREIDE